MAPVAPRIKFCGITTLEDAQHAATLGAWAVGLIFWPRSPRRCRPSGGRDRRRAQAARRGRRRVRQSDPDELAQAADAIGLTMLQLHGDEGPVFCAEAARRTGCKVIKAARVRSGADIQALGAVPHRLSPARQPRARDCPEAPARRSPGSSPARTAGPAADPQRRPDAGERRRGDRAPCGPSRSTWPAASSQAPGVKDPAKLAAFADAVPARPRRVGRRMSTRRAPLRPLRGPVRPRDADAGAGRARDGLDRGPRDPAYRAELDALLRDYVGRPTPLYHATRLSEAAGHPIYLKREDLNHTGAHKINNALGQALLARRMGKRRIIAETGAGQHGVATATACALLDLECVVYMGTEDMRRQKPERRADGPARGPRRAGARPARGRSRRRSRRRSATGSPTSRRRTTSSARASARLRTRRSSGTCSA